MILHTQIKEIRSLFSNEASQPRVVSPSSEIIGEGAAIFTDMTETNIECPR